MKIVAAILWALASLPILLASGWNCRAAQSCLSWLPPRQRTTKSTEEANTANLEGNIKVTNVPVPSSKNLASSDSRSESTIHGITLAMTVVAIVLMGIYFAISVLAISH